MRAGLQEIQLVHQHERGMSRQHEATRDEATRSEVAKLQGQVAILRNLLTAEQLAEYQRQLLPEGVPPRSQVEEPEPEPEPNTVCNSPAEPAT